MRLRMMRHAAWALILCGHALAAELAPDVRALIEEFQSYRRVAAGYLRSQNAELGAVEVERLRDRLAADRGRLSAASQRDEALTAALAATEALIAGGLKAADRGDTERARTLLEEAAAPLNGWRKARGIRLFSDCVAEISAAYERLDRYRIARPDLANDAIAGDVSAAATRTIAALDACEREAPQLLREGPEFRRLFDGMGGSLRQVPEVVRKRDNAHLHRLLIEQRSFERLIAFRFG